MHYRSQCGCPPGELATNASLVTCLHQVSKMSGVSRLASNAIRSVAFLLEEMEETTINEMVRDVVISQLNELTLDMKFLITDVKEKIDTHIKPIQTQLPPPTNLPTVHEPMQKCSSTLHHMQIQC